MNEITINTANQTPIEIALGIDEEGMTTARKLYAFLEFRSGDYARWYRRNIIENEFAEENVDYFPFRINAENLNGGRPTQDSKLSSAFAKKLSMQKITEAVKRKGTLVLGGKESNAYNSRSIRQKVYSNIHSNLRYQFQVKSYKAIKRSQVEQAVKIIGEYKPPVFLKNEIDTENAQQRFF